MNCCFKIISYTIQKIPHKHGLKCLKNLSIYKSYIGTRSLSEVDGKDNTSGYPKLDVCYTSITEKKENFDDFVKLIKNQFWHGGDKYKLNEQKEFTDGICEMFPGCTGVDWVLGTILKYLGRYKNFGREKDLLKIATYCYILWLKGGFHKNKGHDEDIFE